MWLSYFCCFCYCLLMSFARDIVKRHKSARRKTAANNKHHTLHSSSSSSDSRSGITSSSNSTTSPSACTRTNFVSNTPDTIIIEFIFHHHAFSTSLKVVHVCVRESAGAVCVRESAYTSSVRSLVFTNYLNNRIVYTGYICLLGFSWRSISTMCSLYFSAV